VPRRQDYIENSTRCLRVFSGGYRRLEFPTLRQHIDSRSIIHARVPEPQTCSSVVARSCLCSMSTSTMHIKADRVDETRVRSAATRHRLQQKNAAIRESGALPRSWILDRLGSATSGMDGFQGDGRCLAEESIKQRRRSSTALGALGAISRRPSPVAISPKRSPSRLTQVHLADNQAILVLPPLETRARRAELQCRLPEGKSG
jgi:hypothetical protein